MDMQNALEELSTKLGLYKLKRINPHPMIIVVEFFLLPVCVTRRPLEKNPPIKSFYDLVDFEKGGTFLLVGVSWCCRIIFFLLQSHLDLLHGHLNVLPMFKWQVLGEAGIVDKGETSTSGWRIWRCLKTVGWCFILFYSLLSSFFC